MSAAMDALLDQGAAANRDIALSAGVNLADPNLAQFLLVLHAQMWEAHAQCVADPSGPTFADTMLMTITAWYRAAGGAVS